MSNIGLIYLVQPSEYIGTNVYKIGYSLQENFTRLLSYGRNTKYICNLNCENPLKLETIIKQDFSQKYRLIRGYEYFEGSEQEILNNFIELVMKYNNETYEFKKILKTEDDDKKYHDMISSIKLIFINYLDDIAFGGIKQLIYITDINIDIGIKYKKISKIDDIYSINNYECKFCCIKNYDYRLLAFLNKIISLKIIEVNKIYDFNNDKFIKKLEKYKEKINIITFDDKDIKDIYFEENSKYSIFAQLNTNIIINDKYRCVRKKDNDKFLKMHDILLGLSNNFKLIKIHNRIYDYNFVKKYIPYIIIINDLSNEYYILNPDDDLILFMPFDKNFVDINLWDFYDGDYDDWGNYCGNYNFLETGVCGKLCPLEYIYELQKLITKYNSITKNKQCLNNDKEKLFFINLIINKTIV
jgi:hypothetical protein